MKIKHFIPAKNAIFIPGENAKNGHERFSTIPDFMIQLLINHASISTDTENYMFSGKNFIPGKILTETRDVGRYWQKLRKILSLPNEIQFYSLRDSGIIQMLTEGVPPQEVKRQADHSSLEITDRYLRHAKPGENLNIKRMCEI